MVYLFATMAVQLGGRSRLGAKTDVVLVKKVYKRKNRRKWELRRLNRTVEEGDDQVNDDADMEAGEEGFIAKPLQDVVMQTEEGKAAQKELLEKAVTGKNIAKFYSAAIVERVQNKRLRAAPKSAAASSARPKHIELTPSPKKRRVSRAHVKTIKQLTPEVQDEDAAAYAVLVSSDVAGWVSSLKKQISVETEDVQAKKEKKKKSKK
eukprot:s5356_g1.t1